MMNKKLMNQRLKIAIVYLSGEEGFVMPIAVGFGLVMLIIALTMIMRSQSDVVSASSQKTVSGALAAAETGIARYQSFISKNKAIAVYPDCNSRSVNGTCSDTGNTQKSWSNASVISELSGGSSSSGSCGATTTSGNTAANTVAEIAQQSTTNWQDITDASGVNQGQYKLVSYSGVPSNTAPGNATLTVLGRVKQSGTGNTATSKSNTATTKLVISIPVSSTTTPNTVTNTGTAPAGLWANSFSFSGGNAIANANVQDASCGGTGTTAFPTTKDASGNYTRIGTVDDGNPATANPRGTLTLSTQAFPDLPNGNQYTPPTLNVNNISTGINRNNGTLTLPGTGDINSNGVAFSATVPQNSTYIYRIGASGSNSINLSGNASITFGSSRGACNETIIIYADADLNLSGNGLVAPTVCAGGLTTKVIFYTGPNASLTLTGNGATYNPKYFKFYMYGTGTEEVNLTGNGSSSAFIFAPFIATRLTGNGNVSGSLWTKSFTATGNGNINQSAVSWTDLSEISQPASGSIQTINLGNVNSWQRQSVN
ncbi:DUF7305 domain-containing protein [Dolichospermum flos-aquae]|uniref:Uncharacterized protein n=2 Tax=Nostocales TaxID=1161 RepID=A0ACC7S512_DOLFA|nr:hypothetical protein [Dolichospermum flos-aquae]MTJ43610.1 hypothetical protein [Dolichospermum flos-aquae UHCC 0037]